MKKALILVAIATSAALAVGPIRTKYITLLWTPANSEGTTGYWVYWRTETTAFNDTNRVPAATNQNVSGECSYDLTRLPIVPGKWFLAVSATNEFWAEGPLSNEAIWNSASPAKPTILSISR